MQRYIDARYIINRITEERRKWGDDYDVEQVLGDIEDAQTIEVVLCKDCKHRYGKACDFADFWLKDDDYCSRGERRENGRCN